MSAENPTAVDDYEDRNRPLQMHEVRSLVDQLRQANLHVYTKQAWRRDRTLGWILTFAILAAIGWMVWYNYQSTQDLRENIYQSCMTANDRVQAERTLFATVASETKDQSFKTLLLGTSSQLNTADCAGKYLGK